MCEIRQVVRAFILRPHKLYKGGVLLKEIIFDFQKLQKGYNGDLDIFFLKSGGFAICFPPEFPEDEIADATPYLVDTLGILPRIIDLTQVT